MLRPTKPSGRVVTEATGAGGFSARASRRASSNGDSKGTADTVAPDTALFSAKIRPLSSPAAKEDEEASPTRHPAKASVACLMLLPCHPLGTGLGWPLPGLDAKRLREGLSTSVGRVSLSDGRTWPVDLGRSSVAALSPT
jgi:hypothetical protein